MLYGCILAGGFGKRFWPESRKHLPKQMLRIASGKTLLRQTIERILPLIPAERIFVVTHQDQQKNVKRQLHEVPSHNIITEPLSKNTAAPIGLASIFIKRKDKSATVAVFPADHIISPREKFLKSVKAANVVACKEPYIITFGIKPTRPATGFGYIQRGLKIISIDNTSVYDVARFCEKPNLREAQRLVRNGNFYWNSGIFVFQAKVMLGALEKLMPSLFKGLKSIEKAIGNNEVANIIKKEYKNFKNISVDYGVMEKAQNVRLIEVDFDWDDVGSWSAIGKFGPRDKSGNTILSKYVGIDTKNTIIVGENLIATIGVKDLIIVQTDDATLICHKSKAEDVKKLVEKMEKKGLEEYL